MWVRTSLALITALSLAATAGAQGLQRGARDGAERGQEIAALLGAAVGGAIGAAVGTANSLLGVDRRERFRIYALREHRPFVVLPGPVRVGSVPPEDVVVYYDVPREFALPEYSYTIVTGHLLLVEPGSRRIVEVIN